MAHHSTIPTDGCWSLERWYPLPGEEGGGEEEGRRKGEAQARVQGSWQSRLGTSSRGWRRGGECLCTTCPCRRRSGRGLASRGSGRSRPPSSRCTLLWGFINECMWAWVHAAAVRLSLQTCVGPPAPRTYTRPTSIAQHAYTQGPPVTRTYTPQVDLAPLEDLMPRDASAPATLPPAPSSLEHTLYNVCPLFLCNPRVPVSGPATSHDARVRGLPLPPPQCKVGMLM
jgi:hypothetical protein